MMNTATADDPLPDPALAFADPDGAGDVAFDEGDLAGVREPLADVRGGVRDLDGAALAAAVTLLFDSVLDGDLRPVQGVEFLSRASWCCP
jgi:hypothetical protein